MQIAPDSLRRFATEILSRASGQPGHAAKVADRLVIANLTGHDSHGVGMVPKYVEGIRAGQLNPKAKLEVISDKGPFLQVDGHFGFGHVITEEAMDLAIAKARENHFALLSLRNSFHIGRIGDWGEMAASAGFISIHYVNVLSPNALVAPFGGSAARFATNPYCTAIPATDRTPMTVLDIATSTIAHGKARVAYLSGKKVPWGSLIDAEGRETDDPTVMFEEPQGALTTFGAHKGFGLAMLADLLGGSFSGGGAYLPERVVDSRIVNNMLAILIDPNVFGGAEAFFGDLDAYTAWVKSSPPAPGVVEVMVPGDPERHARKARALEIPVDSGTWTQLIDTAKLVGMDRAEIFAFAGS